MYGMPGKPLMIQNLEGIDLNDNLLLILIIFYVHTFNLIYQSSSPKIVLFSWYTLYNILFQE